MLEAAPLNPNSPEGVSGEDIVQISPQRVRVRVRPLEAEGHRVTFSIAQSSQYPVDIYFLLDLSWSMDKSRDNFAQQGMKKK